LGPLITWAHILEPLLSIWSQNDKNEEFAGTLILELVCVVKFANNGFLFLEEDLAKSINRLIVFLKPHSV